MTEHFTGSRYAIKLFMIALELIYLKFSDSLLLAVKLLGAGEHRLR